MLWESQSLLPSNDHNHKIPEQQSISMRVQKCGSPDDKADLENGLCGLGFPAWTFSLPAFVSWQKHWVGTGSTGSYLCTASTTVWLKHEIIPQESVWICRKWSPDNGWKMMQNLWGVPYLPVVIDLYYAHVHLSILSCLIILFDLIFYLIRFYYQILPDLILSHLILSYLILSHLISSTL